MPADGTLAAQFAPAVSANPFGSSSKIYTIRPYDERDMAHTSKKLTAWIVCCCR